MPNLATRARLPHALLLVPTYLAVFHFVLRVLGSRLFPGENLLDAGPHAFVLFGVDIVFEVVLVLGLGLFWLGGIGPRDIGWRFEAWRAEVARGALGFAAASVIILGFAVVAGDSVAEIGHELVAFTLRQRLFFVGIGVMAAVTEESVYRGYLQPALVARLGLTVGVLVTALIFAAAHLRFTPLALLGKLAVGLVFGVQRGRDRSLLAPAVTHLLIWSFWGTV